MTQRTKSLVTSTSSSVVTCCRYSSWVSTLFILLIYVIGNNPQIPTSSIDTDTEYDEYLSASPGRSLTSFSSSSSSSSSTTAAYFTVESEISSFFPSVSLFSFPIQLPSFSSAYLSSLLFPSSVNHSSLSLSTSASVARSLQTSTAAYWKPLDWGPCSVPCGGGVQNRLVVCWANLTQRETDASACPLSRPTRKRQCNKFLCPSVDVTEFSCDVNAIGGAIRCPPQYQGGGRLNIRIMQAYSLPSFETYTWSGRSDPYVVVKIGNIERRTTFVMNNVEHPVWGDTSKLQNAPTLTVEDPYAEDDPTPIVSSGPLNSIAPEGELLFFGIQDTLTPITIELWDSDGGFEGNDDLLGTIYTNVIACSALSDFCDERTWLPLTIGDDCFFTYDGARNATMPDPSKTCLHIEQIITPFNLTFEQPLPPELAETRIGPRPWLLNLSIANTYVTDPSNIADMYREGGKLEADFPLFKPAHGGLIARSSIHDYLLGDNYSTAITVNYRCYVYLFRYTADGLFESAEPPWLRDPSNGWTLTEGDGIVASRPIGIYNPNGTYRAYVRFASAFSTFYIHGPTAGIVVLNNETLNVTGAIPVSNTMYFVVARHWTDDVPTELPQPKAFDRAAFLQILPIFIIPELFFLFLTIPFCISIQFRFDMIEPYLATRILPRTRDGPKAKAGDRASGQVTVTRILLPTNPEHLIASALLDHPDTLRAENSRRRQLDTDVTAFFKRTVISGVQDDSTPNPPSRSNLSTPASAMTGASMYGSTNDLARSKSMTKTQSLRKSKSNATNKASGKDAKKDAGVKEKGKDSEDTEETDDHDEVDNSAEYRRPRRRDGSERIRRAKSRLAADYDSDEELDRQMQENNINFIGEEDEDKDDEENAEEEAVETIDPNNPVILPVNAQSPAESSSLFSDSEVKSTKKPVIRVKQKQQRIVGTREMNFEQSSSFYQASGSNPDTPNDPSKLHNLSPHGFSFLVRKDHIDVPRPIPVVDSQTVFHRRLYWTAVLVRMLLIVPFLINLAHGIVIISTLQPRAVGVAILLFGSLGYISFWAIGQFIYGGYKPNAFIIDTLLLFLVSSIVYLYIAVAMDPIPIDYHLSSLTAVSATASFFPMVLLAFLNTEALSDAITSMQGLSKVLRQEEDAEAERRRKEAKKKMEETGKIKSESSFEMKTAKKKAEEASISVTSALGVPPEVAPALGSVLGTAALVCYDYAIDPNKSVIPSELQEKTDENGEEEKIASGKAPKLRQTSFRNKSAKQLFEGDDEMEDTNEEVTDPQSKKTKDDKITPGVAGFMSKKGPEWESAYRKQLEAHLGHLAEEVLQREKALAEKLEKEKQAKEAEYRAVIKQAAEAAAADSQRSNFARSGVSLGLSEQDDTILRLTSVASAPWLQPHGEGVTRPFSFRSPTHILGTLLGQRVFSLLGSAPTIELHKADGFNDIISLHSSVVRKLSRLCLVVSYTILLLHAIIVGLYYPLYWFDGIVTAVSLAIQDWTAYCLITSFLLNRGPVYFTLLLAASRAVIVWYCGNTWLAGQAFAYALWGIALGYEAGIHRLPAISDIASEFICYLGLFQLGKEYATAVTATNEAAKTFQQDTARFFGVDLKRNYVAEEETARRRRKARLKKGKAADDDDDDDLDENNDKDDPYSMERVKERENAKKQLEEKAKTPLAGRYQARERVAVPSTNPDGTPNETAVDYNIGRKDETKVVRTAATRLLQNALQSTAASSTTTSGKGKDKAAAAAEARAVALAEASKRANAKVQKGKKAKPNQVVPIDEETGTDGHAFDTSGSSFSATSEDPADTSAIAMAAYARRHRKITRSFLSEVLQLREAWSALLFLTVLYIPILLAGIGFYESRVAWANAQPKYEAGLFDSEVVYLVPSINFFGVLTKVWIVGIAALATVTLTLFVSATITAFQLRGKGLLPPSFDILLPIITKKNKELRRIPYPEFMVVLTEFVSIVYGIIFYVVSGSGTVLVLSVMILPILGLIGFIGQQFIDNGYSLLQPGRYRPRMSVAYLLELNALAGYPLADKKYLNKWRNTISVEDGYLLHKLEFGPGGHGTSVFSHPVARGEGYTPGADITGLDLYGNGKPFQKENMDFINRSAKEDEARRKHTVQSTASLYGQNKANKNTKPSVEEANTASSSTGSPDTQSQRMVALQQTMLKRGQGACACFSRYYYRWKLRGLASQNMSFLSALFRGYLTPTDINMLYATIGLFFLVFVTGIICAFTTTSPIIGHSMWYGLFVIFTSAPVVATYIQTARWKFDMLVPICFSYLITALGIAFMMVQLFLLQGPDERVVYSSACAGGYWGLLIGIIAYTSWSRNDYRFRRPTILMTLYFYLSMAGVNFAIYGWGSFYTGVALSFVILAIFIAQFSVWIYYGFNGYVPASWRRFVYAVMAMITVGAVVIGISEDINLFYCFSVGFFFLLLRYGGRAIIRLLSLDDDSPLVCGPLIFPLFSYDIETGQPRSEDLVGTDVIRSFLILFAWGIFAIMFVDPLFTGIGMVCGTLVGAVIIVARTSIHTPLAIGSFAPYIDTDAVRGARTMATNTFFSRRILAPVEKMLNTAEGATVVDGFSNAMLSAAAYEKTQKDRQRMLQAKKILRAENQEDTKDTVTVEDTATGETIHLRTAKGGLAAISGDDAFGTLNRSLSFLDPSYRDATTTELASQAIARMNAGRDTCAKGLAQMACMRWCVDNAWPWQIPETMFNKELFITLLSRLQVSADEMMKKHEKIIASVNCECACMNATSKAEEVEKRLQKEIRTYVIHAAAELAHARDVTDVDEISATLQDSEFMVQPLTDFTQAMINVIRKKSLLTKAQEMKRLQEAQEWLEKNVLSPLSPGPNANVTPSRPIPPMLGALRSNLSSSKKLLSTPTAGTRRGFSASPSLRNLNAELNPSASAKAELKKLVAGGNRSSTRSLIGSTDNLPVNSKDGSATTASTVPVTPVRSASSGPSLRLRRGDTLRSLERVAKAANAFQTASQSSTRSLSSTTGSENPEGGSKANNPSVGADVKNAREARKKGGNTGATNGPSATDEGKPKVSSAPVSEIVVGRRKRETCTEVVYRNVSDFFSYFIGTPPEAIPPPIQPVWQAEITRGDALASDEFKRTKAKKSVVYYALTSYLAYMDTAQLASFLIHPMYTPVERPDRPWTWREAIVDGFVLGDGPFGFVVLYGFLFDIVRTILRFLNVWCGICGTEDTYQYGTRTRRSSKGWRKSKFPNRLYSRNHTVGCCGRRAPLYAKEAIPSEYEIDRLVQQYTEYTGQPVRIVRSDDEFLQNENFPDLQTDASLTLSVDGTPVRTAPIDFHGITQPARNTLFGLITRAKGWLPDRLPKTTLETLFGSAVLPSSTRSKSPSSAKRITFSPTRASSGAVDGKNGATDPANLSSSSGTDSDTNVRPRNVAAAPTSSASVNPTKPPFTVAPDEHVGLVVTVGPEGGRILGIESPVQRATAPASHTQVYAGMLEAQRTVGIEFYEEIRALLHFQMLLASYGRARLQSHRSRYPYFVDVVTKTLKTAGATLPTDGKPLHVDLVNTACWLSTLEEKHQLLYRRVKQVFDNSMRMFKHSQLQLYKALVASKIRRDGELEQRAQAFLDAHSKVSKAIASTVQARIGEEMHRKAQKEATQIALQLGSKHTPSNDDVTMVGEIAKIESYSISETMIGRILVHEVEKLKKNCSQIAGGRMRPYTFVDPDFLPDNKASIGELNPPRLSEVLAPVWRLSPAFNKETRLFTSGSDPDDVIQGYMLKDGWLMSAIAMMAASGGLGDNSVDPLIDNLFITKRESETGVYAVRLNVQGHWISLLLDDAFPVLHDAFRAEWSRKTPKSRGAAVAHARDFGELWVPLIEKAVAKLYGGYGELNRGYIEHGLQILTGADTQRLPLQVVVDGPFRARLWKEMVRNIRECGYLLGAETFSIAATLHSVDKNKTNATDAPLSADGTPMLDLLPNGLAPSSVYLIYDIQQIGKHRLVKLREPPSVKSAWKGDFSAESEAWTSRLVTQLNWSAIDDDENRTFWMSFDDFCNNFQSLYTCRVMDADRWYRFTAAGVWNGPTAAGLLKEINEPVPTENSQSASLDDEEPDRDETPDHGVQRSDKNAKYGVSEIHLNPQYALDLSHATSVCITLQQAPIVDEASGSSTIHDIHPVAIYIVNRAGEDASRLDLAAYNAQVNARYVAAAGEIRHAQEGMHNHSGDISNFGTTFRLPSQHKGTDENEHNDAYLDDDDEDEAEEDNDNNGTSNAGNTTARSASRPNTDAEDEGTDYDDDKPKHFVKNKKAKRNKKGERIISVNFTAPPREPTEAEIEIARAALGKETGTATSLWDEGNVSPFLPRSDGRVYALTSSNVAATSGAPISRDTVRVYAHLPAGRYVILPVTQYAGQEGMFGLIVEATSEITLTQLWPPLISKEEVDAHLSANEASSKGTLEGSTARAADAAIERHVDKLMMAYGFGEFMRKKHEKDNSVSAQIRQIANVVFNDISKFGKVLITQAITRIERGLGIGGDVQCYSQIKTLKTQEVHTHLNHARLYNQAFDDALRLADSSPGGASTHIYEAVTDNSEYTDKFMRDYDLPLFRHWGDDIVHINEVVDTNELYATMANVQSADKTVDLRSNTKGPSVWASNASPNRPSSRSNANNGGKNPPPIVQGTSVAAQGFDN